MDHSRSLGLFLQLGFFLLRGALAVAPLMAQDVATQLTGRMDSSYTWTSDPLPSGGQNLGLVTGWAGITGGTKDMKTEIRVGYTNYPALSLDLSRAWLKFRFPGVRFTSGLGRLAWGTGFVLVPGDLLFDTVGTGPDFASDELRTQGAWLGDAWFSLGDEAFAEAAVLQDSAGARISAAPLGVTVEGAGAWDRMSKTVKAAVSTQFHFGLDWYSTLRQDLPDSKVLSFDHFSAGFGAFGLWAVTDGVNLSTRHEALVPGKESMSKLKSYHDVSVAFNEGWSLTGRVLVDRAASSWLPSAEGRWSAIQNLGLYTTATLKAPWVFRVGAAAKW